MSTPVSNGRIAASQSGYYHVANSMTGVASVSGTGDALTVTFIGGDTYTMTAAELFTFLLGGTAS